MDGGRREEGEVEVEVKSEVEVKVEVEVEVEDEDEVEVKVDTLVPTERNVKAQGLLCGPGGTKGMSNVEHRISNVEGRKGDDCRTPNVECRKQVGKVKEGAEKP